MIAQWGMLDDLPMADVNFQTLCSVDTLSPLARQDGDQRSRLG